MSNIDEMIAKLAKVKTVLSDDDNDKWKIVGNWMAELWEELQAFSPVKWDEFAGILRGPRDGWEIYVKDAHMVARQYYKAQQKAAAVADLSTVEGREAMRQANLLRHATQSWSFALVGQYDDFVSQWAKAMSYNFVEPDTAQERQAEASEVKSRALDQLIAKLRPH